MKNILLLEDSSRDSDWEKPALEKLGYNVFLVNNIEKAKSTLSGYKDIVVAILDFHLAGQEISLPLCEHIRTRYPAIKVIYLTAFEDHSTSLKIKAAGAHAVWHKKEFRVDLQENNGTVMLKNIDNLLGHESKSESPSVKFSHGKFEADLAAGVYKVKGKEIKLSGKEKKILNWFLRNPNRAFNANIYNNHYAEDDAMTSGSFKTHIKTLKQKLSSQLRFEVQMPVKDFGYFFRAEV